MNFIQKNLFAI